MVVKKILVIRFSSIGDIVLTTPVLRCIKNQIPDVELHYLTKAHFKTILESNPNVDKIHCLDDSGLSRVIAALKKEKFDFIADLHKNLRTTIVKTKLAGIPSASFPKINIPKWLIVNMKINRLPDVHIVDRYFYAVKPLDVQNDNKGLEYYIDPKDNIDIQTFPELFRKEYVAMVIGGRHFTKIFPVEKIISLGEFVNKQLMLLGGKEDYERGEQIRNALGEKVYNTCGMFNINQSASLIRKASRVITNDTGLMHIAAAFQKDVLSIWGNTIPGFGMYPYLPADSRVNSVIMEVENLSCRPCSKLGYNKCPKGHFNCMMNINETSIINFINQ